MIDASIIKKKLQAALSNFSQEAGVPYSDVQISISMDEKNINYFFLKNYKQVRRVNFKKDILKLAIDFFSAEEMATKIIGTTFIDLALKNNTEVTNLDVMITGASSVDEPLVHLYKDKCKTHIASPSFEEFFNMKHLMQK